MFKSWDKIQTILAQLHIKNQILGMNEMWIRSYFELDSYWKWMLSYRYYVLYQFTASEKESPSHTVRDMVSL